MSYQSTALAPVAAEVINQVSGTYAAPFWDGLLAVTGSLDTIRAVKDAIEALHDSKKDIEAYGLILSLYDLAAIEVPCSITDLEPYPEGIASFISEFILDIEDLLIDYESETQETDS